MKEEKADWLTIVSRICTWIIYLLAVMYFGYGFAAMPLGFGFAFVLYLVGRVIAFRNPQLAKTVARKERRNTLRSGALLDRHWYYRSN